ncbi:phenylacetate-CoA oxygenase, PaaI subunit [Enterobacter cancerogenus]|uniref:Phenylacetate-CoA oxygenase, PaaI subunit n=1 Tax=Enterobacter cancerogenus TaxID=69218 RepID=A0A484Z462_9ENTR|nr:phenylacetate-CoA oxygenase, PaaI subunit [Enterobacter cancerogenus]
MNSLWRFTAELFDADDVELALIASGVAVDPRTLREPWEREVFAGLQEATLSVPDEAAYRTGGKRGLHTEHLGPMLAEMQYLQRVYPRSAVVKESAMQRLVDIAPGTNPANLGAVKPDPGPGSSGAHHHRFRHGAQRKGAGRGLGHWFYADLFGLPGNGTPAGGDP